MQELAHHFVCAFLPPPKGLVPTMWLRLAHLVNSIACRPGRKDKAEQVPDGAQSVGIALGAVFVETGCKLERIDDGTCAAAK